jgi:CRP-like cAMP-binding protein
MYEDQILHFEDGEVIFEEGSIGNEFYIIEQGKVEISQRINGNKTTIAVLERDDFFGEMAAITDAPRSATATALGETDLICLSTGLLFKKMQSNPHFTAKILQTLINRLRNTTSTLRLMIARMDAIDIKHTDKDSSKDHDTEGLIERLKKQIEIKDKQIELQRSIIVDLTGDSKEDRNSICS